MKLNISKYKFMRSFFNLIPYICVCLFLNSANKINKYVIVLHIARGINNLNELSRKYFPLLLNKQHNQLF